MLAADADFENKEWVGASSGAMLSQTPPESPGPEPTELQIEPPPWAGREAELHPGQLNDRPPGEMDALSSMKIADEGSGYNPKPPGRFSEPLPEPMPPTFEIPKPDWMGEEAERLKREARQGIPPANQPGVVEKGSP